MKTILFVIPSFRTGGTVTALINLLSYLDRNKYTPSVYALSSGSDHLDEIGRLANVVNSIPSDRPQTTSSKGSLFKLGVKFFHLFLNTGIDLSPLYFKRLRNKLDTARYDYLVAFQEGIVTQFVANCPAKRKIAWIHSDCRRFKASVEKSFRLYDKYDKIVNVSKTAHAAFVNYMPRLAGKSVYVYNLINESRVKQLAVAKPAREDLFSGSGFSIISIGRMDPIKHFSSIPSIARKITDAGCSFKWLILGGPTKTDPEEPVTIEKGILEYEVSDRVFMLGSVENPYPYLIRSNLLVCLSETETFNYVLAEARLLGVPIVTTNYDSAAEFVNQDVDGVIVQRESISNTIISLINDPVYYSRLRESVKSSSFIQDQTINKLNNSLFQ